MNQKKILFLQRQPPSTLSREALDAILVAAVFEQHVSVLFRNEGVLQLVQPSDGGLEEDSLKQLKSFADYGVTSICACQSSINQFAADAELIVPVTFLDLNEQRALIAEQDAVVSD